MRQIPQKRRRGASRGKFASRPGRRADQQRDNAASGLASVAGAVRRMGEGLRGQDQGAIADYTAQYGDKLANRIERTSDYLRGHDVGQIVTEVENFARRRPGMFLGGAFLLGLAATRFLKSSRQSSEHQRAYPQANWSVPDPNKALPPAVPRKNVAGESSTRPGEGWGDAPQSAPGL